MFIVPNLFLEIYLFFFIFLHSKLFEENKTTNPKPKDWFPIEKCNFEIVNQISDFLGMEREKERESIE